MNNHILIAMDWKNRSREELFANWRDARDAARDAHLKLSADSWEARDVAWDVAWDAWDASRASRAANAARYSSAAKVERRINEYFEVTGENREDYEKALEDMRK